jgi:hypothetical protein
MDPQHAPTPTSTPPYMEFNMSVWHKLSSHTQSTARIKPKPKTEPISKLAVWCAIYNPHTHTKKKIAPMKQHKKRNTRRRKTMPQQKPVLSTQKIFYQHICFLPLFSRLNNKMPLQNNGNL